MIRPSTKRRISEVLTRVLFGTLFLLACAVILFPVFAQTKNGHSLTPSRRCGTNMKMMGVSLLMYAGDWDDRLPGGGWMDAAVHYKIVESRLRCPSLARQRLSGYGYAANVALRGKSLEALPSKVPMLFESSDLGRNRWSPLSGLLAEPRHDGERNVLDTELGLKRL
jgi:hypothetical protein